MPRQPCPPGATLGSPGSRADLTIMVKDSLAQIAAAAAVPARSGRADHGGGSPLLVMRNIKDVMLRLGDGAATTWE